MKTKTAWFTALLLFLVFSSSSTVAVDQSGCLTCHTNEKIIKMLYKPPATGPSEGEG
ncbi:MAG TPA: hypothetical protein PK425_11420 [Syntrophales bacterium]|jgi:cytochrome c oxidase assembly factor CtaG|nr:hypothetical protein [Syntrophales bacterium]HPX57135.1 hypothetical protein [Syntrophales bacterium]HQA83528.1 hypothetical protein [Syntrophales bacterium]